jgi:hypothetical protein
MNQRDRDYDELLRRALRASADSVVPAEDGLERIRARLSTPHPALVAWMMAGFSEVASRAAAGLQSVSDWLRPMPGAARERLRVTRPGPRRGGLARLRPTAVLAIAVFVVAGGALALTPLPGQAISQTAALIRSFGSGGPAGGTGGSPLGGGSSRNLSVGERAVRSTAPGPQNHRHVAAVSCAVAASASRAASSTTCPSPPASVGPTTCPSPTGSPAPSSTGSPGPAASPSPSGSPALGPTGGLVGAPLNPIVSPDRTACPSPAASPAPSPAESPSPTGSPTPSSTGSPTPSPAGSSTPSPAGSPVPTSTGSPSPAGGPAPSSTGSPSPAG